MIFVNNRQGWPFHRLRHHGFGQGEDIGKTTLRSAIRPVVTEVIIPRLQHYKNTQWRKISTRTRIRSLIQASLTDGRSLQSF